jgi:protein involved in polysaccharide export with SLBB domain
MIGCWARSLVLGLVVGLVLASCSSSPPPAAVPNPAAVGPLSPEQQQALVENTYRLGSGDKLRIIVFGHQDLSGEFSLDGAGNFAMPLIGEVNAGGLTTRELEQRIQERFRDGYLIDPQVSIEVMNYRPFFILGEVKNPKDYPYESGMTILRAVATAGGFTYRAKQNEFLLQRGGSRTAPVRVGGDQALLPGDIVTVQERFF